MIKPYFHPTVTLVVDDDIEFVESFLFRFQDDLNCKDFYQPAKALEFLKTLEKSRPTLLLQEQSWNFEEENNKKLNLSNILSYANRPERLSQVSVVVVDYDMPGMNGVEFCKQIVNLPMRRIMLTGKADQKVAIDAFNEGLIHKFILKQEEVASTRIRISIDLEQQAYFDTLQRPLVNMLYNSHESLMKDLSIEKFLSHIIETQHITEYYLSLAPKGFLLIDGGGKSKFLLLQNMRDIRAQWEIAEAEGAPAELVSLLKMGNVLALFPSLEGHYISNLRDWRSYIHTAQSIPGSDWLCALVDQVPSINR